MNTDRFFMLWFLPLRSVFKIPSTCDPRHVGALFPLALNICSKHMFHATYALLKLLLASLLCQYTILGGEIWILSIQHPPENLNEPWVSDHIEEKWGISRPVRQNSSQGSHMSAVCGFCLFVYMFMCVRPTCSACECWREDYYPLPPCIKPPLIQCQRPDPNMAERQHVTCLAFHPRLRSLQAVVAAAVRCRGGCCGVQGRWGLRGSFYYWEKAQMPADG